MFAVVFGGLDFAVKLEQLSLSLTDLVSNKASPLRSLIWSGWTCA